MKRLIFLLVIVLIAFIVLIAGGFLFYSSITEYRPSLIERVNMEGKGGKEIDSLATFTVLTWNLGYGGLGESMNFFYDGGTMVRPVEQAFTRNWEGIRKTLTRFRSIDFLLFQEVDRRARRSYYFNESDTITALFPGFSSVFALNYQCTYMPLPLREPMGPVESGLLGLSAYPIDSAVRYGYSVHPAWPERMYNMKRCFLAFFIPLSCGRSLVMINIHNSAFDTGGYLRREEMAELSRFMNAQLAAGNAIVAGGDWNANPPGFNPEDMATGDRIFSDDFTDLLAGLPGWQVVYDPRIPTNRQVYEAYQQGKTPVSILDFFLISPNLYPEAVETLSLGFENSDHQPVIMTCRIKGISVDGQPQR